MTIRLGQYDRIHDRGRPIPAYIAERSASRLRFSRHQAFCVYRLTTYIEMHYHEIRIFRTCKIDG